MDQAIAFIFRNGVPISSFYCVEVTRPRKRLTSKKLTHLPTHNSHLKVGDAVGSRVGTAVGVCDDDQLDGAGDVGGNVDGATLGTIVGVGDGARLGDCVHAGVLHAACSVVNGHGRPLPSETVVMVRWRLERPPPPADVDWGKLGCVHPIAERTFCGAGIPHSPS